MSRILLTTVMTATTFIALQTANAQSMPPADNTKSNQTDATNREVTADSQKETASDRTLVQKIRKSVLAEKGLSTYAHNVKIVAINGQVTLNGVVRSDDEKTKVASLAAQIAGMQNVINDLKVAPPKS